MNRIDVSCRGVSALDFPVEELCIHILDNLAIDGWELSVLLCNDETIRSLNRQYRNIDAATDVLSFPQIETAVDQGEWTLAGDVVISLDTLYDQAGQSGTTPLEELKVLLIHGILHLTGMDHDRMNSPMLQRQRELFRKI